MLHDTCVHHADARLTAGTPFRLTPELATGVIDEILELFSAPGATTIKPALAELRGTGQTLHLTPSAPGSPGWLITRTPHGITWARATATSMTTADVTVTATPTDLMLLATRRLPADDRAITITGDHALLHHWLAHTAL
jgi:hypothetical protein